MNKVFCKNCKYICKIKYENGHTHYLCKRYYETNYITGEIKYYSLCSFHNINGKCRGFCKKEKPFEKLERVLSDYLYMNYAVVIFILYLIMYKG